MKKNIIKIALDIIIILVLLLMYKKNIISIGFHEIGGLAVFTIFFIHKGLNWNWIKVVSKKFFSRQIPAKARTGYIVNVLLLIAMAFIVISGIMISKTLFHIASSNRSFWQTGHYFTSAIAIILVGIHIGLHWPFVKKMFSKIVRLPRIIARVLGVIFVIAILGYGAYGMATSSYVTWLAAPFSIAGISNENIGQNKGVSDEYRAGENEESKGKRGQQKNSSFSFGGILNLIVTYGSITTIFTAITILVEKIVKRKNPAVIKS